MKQRSALFMLAAPSTILRGLFVILLALSISSCQEDQPVEPPANNSNTSQHSPVELSSLYATLPNVAQCTAGMLVQSERTRILNYVNALRARHGLAAVEYRDGDDRSTAEAALIMLANNVLDHQPPSSYSCWTQTGRDGAEHSNLHMGYRIGTPETIGTKVDASEEAIDSWMKDSLIDNAGHRRWLLNPWLRYISFGRCDKIEQGAQFTTISSASAIRVVYDEMATPSANLRFVAYPMGEYPAHLWNKGIDLSFSVIDNPNDIWANQNVSFAQATITITDNNGGNVAVSNVRRMNDASGIPNALLWRAPLENGRTYTVRINGVQMSTGVQNFEYTITLSTRS